MRALGHSVSEPKNLEIRIKNEHIVIKVSKSTNFAKPIEVILAIACFAANSIITRYLVQSDYISPFTLTVIRFFSGFAMLSILAWLKPGAFLKVKLRGSHLLAALLLGVYAFSISYGYALTPVAAGALIFFTFVVVSMTLFSVVIEGEKLTLRMFLGQILGLAGVSLITFSGVSSVTPIGAVLMASTGLSWGMYSVYGRRFENSFSYTYNSFLLFGVASSALFLSAYPFTGRSLMVGVSGVSLLMALFMGMVSTALGYVLWQRVMKRIRASQGGIAQLLVPILTSIMGVMVLGEEITPPLIIGGVLVMTGIFLCTLRTRII